jgi:hypothetical protein
MYLLFFTFVKFCKRRRKAILVKNKVYLYLVYSVLYLVFLHLEFCVREQDQNTIDMSLQLILRKELARKQPYFHSYVFLLLINFCGIIKSVYFFLHLIYFFFVVFNHLINFHTTKSSFKLCLICFRMIR